MSQQTSLIDQVADAVLYEGYILYPYRPSTKNRHRWTFGGVYPRRYTQSHPEENCRMVTQCLLNAVPQATVNIRIRFLHLIDRQVCQLEPSRTQWSSAVEPFCRPVESLEIDQQLYQSWQEAMEREVAVQELSVQALTQNPHREWFQFPADRRIEPLRARAGNFVGALIRQQCQLSGHIEIEAWKLADNLLKLSVTIENVSEWNDVDSDCRDQALMRSLVSTHTILVAPEGEFVSQIDPPVKWKREAEGCQNKGAWPVLVGEPNQTDSMLSAPIILYDYPQIAPESPGNLFDATEIDEILTLRVLTMTDEEKTQMAALEPQVRELLRRSESLSNEKFTGLHGAWRGRVPDPAAPPPDPEPQELPS